MVTEASEIAWAEVRQLVMFPVAPYVLHRIEFRRVGRQVLKRDAAAFAPVLSLADGTGRACWLPTARSASRRATTIVNAANGLSANGPIYKVNFGPSSYGRGCSRRWRGFIVESRR